MYLLAGFAGGQPATEPPLPHSPSTHAAALQSDYESAWNRADIAQQQIATLQEQVAAAEENTRQIAKHLRAVIEDKKRAEKAPSRSAASGEELEAMRASLADSQKAAESEKHRAISTLKELEAARGQLVASMQAEASASLQNEQASHTATKALMTEYQRKFVEEKRQSDDAHAKLASSLTEREGLKASLIEAEAALESERRNAARTAEQLKAVEVELAARRSLERNRTGITSQLHRDQAVAAFLAGRHELLPAAWIFQAPPSQRVSPDEQRSKGEQAKGHEKGIGVTDRENRKASLEPRTKAPTRSNDHKVTALPRSNSRRAEPESAGAIERSRDAQTPNVRLAEKPAAKVSQRSRSLTKDDPELRSLGALSLPRGLLPDSRFW